MSTLMKPRNPNSVHPKFDSEASLQEARNRMPFERVLEQYGHGPRNGGNLRSFTCPFCQKKNKAGLFKPKGEKHQLFKCQSTSCPTGAQAMDEIGFIERQTGLSRKDAFQAFLKEAGVWRERTTLKSPPPVTQATPPREAATPVSDEPSAEEGAATFAEDSPELSESTPTATGASVEADGQRDPASDHQSEGSPSEPAVGVTLRCSRTGEDEAFLRQCIELILAEQRASISLLQRRLSMGYGRSTKIMDELERRGVVGPSKGSESRDIRENDGHLASRECLGHLRMRFAEQLDVEFPVRARSQLQQLSLKHGIAALRCKRQFLQQRLLGTLVVRVHNRSGKKRL